MSLNKNLIISPIIPRGSSEGTVVLSRMAGAKERPRLINGFV